MRTSTSALFAVASLLAGMSEAFAPLKTPSRTTSLQFGFLKELGLEKPSWLPDFGSKKDEEEAPAPVAEESEGGEESSEESE